MPKRRLAITRELTDGRFRYRRRGRLITARGEIRRIEALAIPPAWTDVEISASPRGRVLARGIDAAGRQQTIYHPVFRRKQDDAKFRRMERFAKRLPKLRAQVERDLRRRTFDRRKVTALAIRLIDQALFRVGNTEYAEEHRSYGLTTLRRKHVEVDDGGVTFDYIGKSGKHHVQRVKGRRVTRLVAELAALPGHEVFRFIDEDGVVRNLTSRHVNAYVKRVMGSEFSAKDFRTWGGTTLAVTEILTEPFMDALEAGGGTRALRQVVDRVADLLGNTAAVTRSSYIDPRVFEVATSGKALERIRRARARMKPRSYCSVNEQCALVLLKSATR